MSESVWWGAAIGSVLAMLVIAYGFLLNTTALPAISDVVIVVLCPPSMSLMAIDDSSWYVAIFAYLYVTAANAALYGLVFALIAKLKNALRKELQDGI